MKVALASFLILLVGLSVSADTLKERQLEAKLAAQEIMLEIVANYNEEECLNYEYYWDNANASCGTGSGNGSAGVGEFVELIVIVMVGLVVAILIFVLLFDYEKKDFIKSIKLKKFGNIKTKASKESETGTDDSDSKSDDTSSTESETTADPFNNNTEPTSEVDDTKEQTTEEESSSSDLQENVAKQSNAIREVKTDLSTLIKNVKDMTQTFMSLQKALNEKDEEIKRLKEGYDDVIVRKFLLRFTKVDKVLKEYMDAGQADLKDLVDINAQLEDALLEANVEPFSPELGSDYKTTQGVADNPEIKNTIDEKQDSTIAEVLQVGYRRRLPDDAEDEFQIIASAKVSIYVYKKPENN